MLTVYSRDNCIFCTKAKALLSEMKLDYDEINVYTDMNIDDFKDSIRPYLKPDQQITVPQIFDGDIFVGGYDELTRYVVKMRGFNNGSEDSI